MQITGKRSNTPLNEEMLRRYAPSVFAEAKHESRSDRYTYIPTINIVKGLEKEGFFPFMVQQARSRDYDRREFTKHLLRFKQGNYTDFGTDQEVNEIILVNSHDGTSSYQMMSGVFRLVCANGMVVGKHLTDEIRIPHRGDIIGRVIEGAYTIVKDTEKVINSIEHFKSVQLGERERLAFARSALALRYDDQEVKPAPITEDQLLTVRRVEDKKQDLWSTFNVVQENIIKGGLHARSANGRSTTTRRVNSIDTDVKLNRALWTLADEMRKIKLAA